MTSRILSVFAALVLMCAAARGQHFAEASRAAVLRSEPDRNALEVGRMNEGERLPLVDTLQTNTFYQVVRPSGATAWVSRYVVRLHAGTLPAPAAPVTPSAPTTGAHEVAWAAFHLSLGEPRGSQRLVREGFVVGYDARLKGPAWVQYRLTAARSADNRFPRTDAFDVDPDVHAEGRAVNGDFSGGYVRGHNAPADDMRWSEDAERDSNYFSNISPQIGSKFNGSTWKSIENRVRTWAESRGDLTIIMGPVYEPRDTLAAIHDQPATERQVLYYVTDESGVAVPTAFFKIIVDASDPQNPLALAYYIPHRSMESAADKDPDTWLTSIDRIEAATGLDLLSALPDPVETSLEASTATSGW
jgi:endonuclease G